MQLVNLSEPERSSEAFSHLQYAAMDGLATVVSEMQMLVVEQWLRLKELAQRQMVWLVKQMVGVLEVRVATHLRPQGVCLCHSATWNFRIRLNLTSLSSRSSSPR